MKGAMALPEPEPEPEPEPDATDATDATAKPPPADWACGLPDEILVHTLDLLGIGDLASCAAVSATWLASARSDMIWSRRCARRWCLGAAAALQNDSAVRRGWESGLKGDALAARLRQHGMQDEEERAKAEETIKQLHERTSGGSWWSLYTEFETKPLSTSWLQPGDHVDCRWGDEDNSQYAMPRLNGALDAGRSSAFWEAKVLEHGSQEGWVRVHYVGYPTESPWAQEWVGEGKLRMTGLVQLQEDIAAGDEIEVRVEPAETLNDRMYWPATIVAVVGRVFLVYYPALTPRSARGDDGDGDGDGEILGVEDEQVREQGGHEYVRRDRIYPLRATRSVD